MSLQKLQSAAAVAALLLVAPAAEAQQPSSATHSAEDGRVVGVVIDETNRTPLAGALVFLSDGRSTETNANGEFVFQHVRAGRHEIAAVTKGCGLVQGGFAVESGRDALLSLEVTLPEAAQDRNARSRGHAARVVEASELQSMADRSLLEVLERVMPSMVERGRFGAQVQPRSASTRPGAEPLLILDGAKVEGGIAALLDGIKAGDVERMEIHRGVAAGWEHGPGNVDGVIEVTTRDGSLFDAERSPESCIRR